MSSFSIYPPGDPKQKLRIQRLFMSVRLYALCAIPNGLAVYNGISSLRVMLTWLALSIIGNGAVYAAIRLNFNLRFKDPSLTTLQLLMAIGLVLYTQIYAGPVRGSYLLALMLAFVFGCFKLSTRQLLWLSLLTAIGYATTIPLIEQVEGPRFNLAIELSLWLTFSIFLPSLCLLAGNVSRMRSQLAASNASLQQALHKVTDLATRDELTGAYNRRYLMDMLEHAKRSADRGGSPFCVCVIDLDSFKQLNDAFGHHAGDAVLKGVTDTFIKMLRSVDIFARYGGDEFIVLLPQSSLETATLCAERVRGELGKLQFEQAPQDFRITISVGIAQYFAPENISTLLERADSALYQAKRKGRDRIEQAEQPVQQ